MPLGRLLFVCGEKPTVTLVWRVLVCFSFFSLPTHSSFSWLLRRLLLLPFSTPPVVDLLSDKAGLAPLSVAYRSRDLVSRCLRRCGVDITHWRRIWNHEIGNDLVSLACTFYLVMPGALLSQECLPSGTDPASVSFDTSTGCLITVALVSLGLDNL